MASIRSSLVDFGTDPSSLRLLDDDSPELLPYTTLITGRSDDDDYAPNGPISSSDGHPH